jgi:hypothetical protein
MRSDTADDSSSNRAANRYGYFLVGYLALSFLGTAVLIALVKHSTALMAGVEFFVTGTFLTLASVAALPALYRDAVALRRANVGWTPGWRKYAAFAVGSPVAAYLVVSYVTRPKIAVLAAGITLVVATVESCAVYLYNRARNVGLAG